MNLEKYKELSGIEVDTSDETLIEAQISRTRYVLETMLGFTLCTNETNTNIYNETGKSPTECACPDVDTSNLLPADDVIGAYRLFRFDKNDEYFHIDPFTAVHAVKLVFIGQGYPEDSGITIKTFDFEEVRVQLGRDGIGKYIQHCMDCFCHIDCDQCVQLAVDADWLYQDCIPKDLQYVWTDMVTYYSDKSGDIRSESITGHSYTKFDKDIPENRPQNLAVIKKYAGPNGSVITFPI